MSPAEADYLLEEWSHWQRGEAVDISWPHATPFGRLIKPDPRPAGFAIDDARAFRTDRVIAKLPKRYRFLIRLHYLDSAPIDAKARRLRVGRASYKLLIKGICCVVAMRIATDAGKV